MWISIHLIYSMQGRNDSLSSRSTFRGVNNLLGGKFFKSSQSIHDQPSHFSGSEFRGMSGVLVACFATMKIVT